MSKQTQRVLSALLQSPQDWRYGYDLAKETGLKSGTLYPLLIRLHDQSLLEAQWHPASQPGRPARHAYRLTRAGIAFASQIGAEKQSAASGPDGAFA